jgi:hypothetical protein
LRIHLMRKTPTARDGRFEIDRTILMLMIRLSTLGFPPSPKGSTISSLRKSVAGPRRFGLKSQVWPSTLHLCFDRERRPVCPVSGRVGRRLTRRSNFISSIIARSPVIPCPFPRGALAASPPRWPSRPSVAKSAPSPMGRRGVTRNTRAIADRRRHVNLT